MSFAAGLRVKSNSRLIIQKVLGATFPSNKFLLLGLIFKITKRLTSHGKDRKTFLAEEVHLQLTELERYIHPDVYIVPSNQEQQSDSAKKETKQKIKPSTTCSLLCYAKREERTRKSSVNGGNVFCSLQLVTQSITTMVGYSWKLGAVRRWQWKVYKESLYEIATINRL